MDKKAKCFLWVATGVVFIAGIIILVMSTNVDQVLWTSCSELLFSICGGTIAVLFQPKKKYKSVRFLIVMFIILCALAMSVMFAGMFEGKIMLMVKSIIFFVFGIAFSFMTLFCREEVTDKEKK